MPVKTKPFDVAESLNSEGRIVAYLEEVFSDGDAAMIAKALGDVARARGITEIARTMGVSRETVYQSFSAEGNPRLSTLLGVAKAMGFEVTIKQAAKKAAAATNQAAPTSKKVAKKPDKTTPSPRTKLPKAA